MRGTPSDLGTPHPLAGTLPGLLGADEFVQRMCTGFDDVMAPVFASLDSFDAYLDPRTTPEDMLGWLAGWIGVELHAGESPQRCRDRVVAGAAMLARRGTARGVALAVESVFGVVPEIVESGGSSWSAQPGCAMPGGPIALLLVRLRVPDAAAVDLERLDALVAAVKPAHVMHRIEVEGDPVPEPPAPEPVARPVRRVPPARSWAPAVVFAPDTPVVTFLIHEEEGDGETDGEAAPPGQGENGAVVAVAVVEQPSGDVVSTEDPSWDELFGDGADEEEPGDDAADHWPLENPGPEPDGG